MRLILSRKGFDSASGGCPSPILPDGAMLALPIPDPRSPTRYRDLTWHAYNLGDVVEQLTKRRVRPRDGAHLDPDLRPGMLPRAPGWRPLLGQCDAAQGHLRNQGVGAGDVFLFWGLFRRVDAELRWAGEPLHALWGWMQVGEVVAVDAIARAPEWRWAARHPHLAFAPADASNTLYVAADQLRLRGCRGLPASGVFESLASERILTAPDAARPSLWSLPGWFMPVGPGGRPLSYHSDASRWTAAGDRVRLRAAARGQEFVLDIEEYPAALEWLAELIGAGARNRTEVATAVAITKKEEVRDGATVQVGPRS